MDNETANKFIDIREVIRKKNPNIMKWIPRFLLEYLRRTIHEDEINDIMQRFKDLQGLDFVDALIKDLDIKVNLYGAENIPQADPVIFAANHPLGGLDGIAFMHAIGAYRPDVKFLVNDILLNIGNLRPLFVGVNKHGSQDKQAISAIEEAYGAENAILVFPAGLVSRKQQKGIIADLEWKKSFITKAKKYKKDVVPVLIDGKNSKFFYNFAKFRQQIGVKVNIEMLYLPDEMFAQRGHTVNIIVGKRIPYTTFDRSKNERAWAQDVKSIVYGLAQGK